MVCTKFFLYSENVFDRETQNYSTCMRMTWNSQPMRLNLAGNIFDWNTITEERAVDTAGVCWAPRKLLYQKTRLIDKSINLIFFSAKVVG